MALDKAQARETFARFCGALNADYAGKYWVTCGTLLGFVRDGGFIGHDGDIDFGMFARDYDDRIAVALEAAGFRLSKKTGRRDNGLALTFSGQHVRADIFFYYEENGRFWHAVTNGPPQVRYWYDPFEVVPARFVDVDTFIPNPPERVLVANYGPDWHLPVKRWHYAYSPFNLSVEGGALHQAKYQVKKTIWQAKSRMRALFRGTRA